MKRCPECRRDYYDETLVYCLDDGSALLDGPASGSEPPASVGGHFDDEPQTAILSEPPASAGGQFSDAATRTQVFTTDQTEALTPGITEPKPKAFDKRLLLASVAIAVIALGGYLSYGYLTGAKKIDSIAVMPFENESGSQDGEYLSDGMTETLISSLTNIPDVSVKARSTVFYYKGKNLSIKQIGEELDVQAVLLGRVSQRGNDLKLSLEMVNTQTQDVIWSEQYNRKQSDLVVLQSEIARDVSTKLRSKLSTAEAAGVEKNYTSNSEAYQLYLQGRFHWNKRTRTDFEKAVSFYSQAIEKDPNYALAYAGLADTYALFPDWADVRPKDYMPKAKQAALRALELDPELAEAHAALGLITLYYDYDFIAAERSYLRAIELNPKYPSARQWYANLLANIGRTKEAITEMSKAAELDPFSRIIIWNLGDAYQYDRQYDEAIKQYQRAMELFSDNRLLVYLGDTYGAKGDHQRAVEAYLSDYRSAGDIAPDKIEKLKKAFETGGWESFGRVKQEIELERIKARQAKDPDAYLRPLDLAYAYSFGRDKDKVIEQLNRGFEDRSADVLLMKNDVHFYFLRDDPRFKDLLKRLNLPE